MPRQHLKNVLRKFASIGLSVEFVGVNVESSHILMSLVARSEKRFQMPLLPSIDVQIHSMVEEGRGDIEELPGHQADAGDVVRIEHPCHCRRLQLWWKIEERSAHPGNLVGRDRRKD